MTNPSENFILTPGADFISGGASDTIVETDPLSLDANDDLIGGGGYDSIQLLTGGTLDLTSPVQFSGFEALAGTFDRDVFILNAARLHDFSLIDGGGNLDILQLAGGGLFDFSNVSLAGIETLLFTSASGSNVEAHESITELGIGAHSSTNDYIHITGQATLMQVVLLVSNGFELIDSTIAGADTSTWNDGRFAFTASEDNLDSHLWQTKTATFDMAHWHHVSDNLLMDDGNEIQNNFRLDSSRELTISTDANADESWSTVTTTYLANGTTVATKVRIDDDGKIDFAGGSADDIIVGTDYSDNLNGRDGNDTITGNLGGDRMRGGLGADTFVFVNVSDSAAGALRDVITDFAEGLDKIDLSSIDADSVLAGDNAFSFIGAAAFTGLGQVRSFIYGANTIVDINTAGTNATDMRIVLAGTHVLDGLDFVL